MNKENDPKNIVIINGVRKFKRWTVLEVNEETVIAAKKYAKENGYTLGSAVERLLSRPLKKYKS